MPTTEITPDAFRDACAECADAIADEDWATAVKWYARAEAINSGLDYSVSDQTLSFRRRDALDNLKTAIEAAQEMTDKEADQGNRFGTFRTGYRQR